MHDLISRQEAIDLVESFYKIDKSVLNIMVSKLKQLPSTETERKKGKWLIILTFNDCYYAKCDQCNETQVFYYNKPLTNFCPNCGADMRGDRK